MSERLGDLRTGIQEQSGSEIVGAVERGVTGGLAAWRQSAAPSLAEPAEARASPLQIKQDRRRIEKPEREWLRKDRALAETAAMLVLSRKFRAIAGNIVAAHAAGARLRPACETAGIDIRTLQRLGGPGGAHRRRWPAPGRARW